MFFGSLFQQGPMQNSRRKGKRASRMNPLFEGSVLGRDAYRQQTAQQYIKTSSKLGGGSFVDSSTAGFRLFGG